MGEKSGFTHQRYLEIVGEIESGKKASTLFKSPGEKAAFYRHKKKLEIGPKPSPIFPKDMPPSAIDKYQQELEEIEAKVKSGEFTINDIENCVLVGIAVNSKICPKWAKLAIDVLKIKHPDYMDKKQSGKMNEEDIMAMWELWQGDGDGEEQGNTVDIEEIKKCKKP